jgi:nucleoside-diphosphate-sugar epimerase
VASLLRASGHAVLGTVYARAPGSEELRLDLARDALSALPPADVLVNAVGEVSPRASFKHVFAANVTVVERLVEWARERRVSHFIQLSSVAVYGAKVVGEGRREDTQRYGRRLGLPYMRTKARAEEIVESSGLPFSLLRAPVVIGPRDTVLSQGIIERSRADGVPTFGGRASRRVSLASDVGIALIVRELITRGPLNDAMHGGHIQTTLRGLIDAYARALGIAATLRGATLHEWASVSSDACLGWLMASALFSQHYDDSKLREWLGSVSLPTLEEAVASSV